MNLKESIKRILREESTSSVKDYLFKYWDKNGTSVDVGKYFALSEFETAQYLFEYRNYDFNGVKEQVKTLIENYHECGGDEFSLRFNNIDFVTHRGGHGDINKWISYNVNFSIKSSSPVFDTIDFDDPEDAQTLYGQIEECVENMLNDTIYPNYGINAHHCLFVGIY